MSEYTTEGVAVDPKSVVDDRCDELSKTAAVLEEHIAQLRRRLQAVLRPSDVPMDCEVAEPDFAEPSPLVRKLLMINRGFMDLDHTVRDLVNRLEV